MNSLSRQPFGQRLYERPVEIRGDAVTDDHAVLGMHRVGRRMPAVVDLLALRVADFHFSQKSIQTSAGVCRA